MASTVQRIKSSSATTSNTTSTSGLSSDSADLQPRPVVALRRVSRVHSGGSDHSLSQLARPFKCPSPALGARHSSAPTGRVVRKRKKVNYREKGSDDERSGKSERTGGRGDDDDDEEEEDPNVVRRRARLEGNKFPVFKPKSSDDAFRARFSVPMLKKEGDSGWDPARPAPLLGMRQGRVFVARPLHDPSGEFAVVLYDPTVDFPPPSKKKMLESDPGASLVDSLASSDESLSSTATSADGSPAPMTPPPPVLMHRSLADILGLKKVVEERPKVPVVIDPRLAKVLRPHQVEGVKFLYRCTTGLIDADASGCIMADEMGLGKTLQCIALMWTLLKQSPEAGRSTISKAIVVCPASLVRNWANELVKWLGKDAVNPFAVDGKVPKEELIRQLRQWASSTGRQVVRPVLIISYETLRMYVSELRDSPIGLILCDEGHRLKNNANQLFTALNGLNVQRRVILSGTPVQNDLCEYFSLLNFANPDYLGSQSDFRRKFETPIMRGRDLDGTDEDRKKGDTALAELATLVNKFIIRRTNDILTKYLPVKYEHVVFCNLTPFQRDVYNQFLQSPHIKDRVLKGKDSNALGSIITLKKLCNHPDLLDLPADVAGSESCLPEDFVPRDSRGRDREVKTWYSGKMAVLDRMLARIRQESNDKIVLISNWTQTLDLFDKLCRARGYGSFRLDGKMSVKKRQTLVDKFNNPDGSEFIFLLSSKAGGCGLNLIGANRLILFDPDWNPAADQQALARVWRDGQKKDCFVYRFISTGTIEEKIFQRQSHKQSLSSCVVDSADDVVRHFSIASLRELFELRSDTRSDTHDTFKCRRCNRDTGHQIVKAPAMLYGDTSTWNHFVNDGPTGPLGKIQDLLLRQETAQPDVSAVFQYISH